MWNEIIWIFALLKKSRENQRKIKKESKRKNNLLTNPHHPHHPPLGGQEGGLQNKRTSKTVVCPEGPLYGKRRRPTLPHCGAVPSARPGLTSLFGMGRGGTPGL